MLYKTLGFKWYASSLPCFNFCVTGQEIIPNRQRFLPPSVKKTDDIHIRK
jgi:hypothetical protein